MGSNIKLSLAHIEMGQRDSQMKVCVKLEMVIIDSDTPILVQNWENFLILL